MNYQHYNKEEFFEIFSKSDVYKQLTQEYAHVVESLPIVDPYFPPSRRDQAAIDESTFYYISFYYLGFLLEKNPKVILDLGCARNYFKKYIPQIYGIDNDPRVKDYVDSSDTVDDTWLNANEGQFDCAFTIGAIHGVSLGKIADRIHKFGKLIKPGGRGYFPFNLRRILQFTELYEFAKLFDLSRSQTKLDLYRVVKQQFESIDYKIIALDFSFLDDVKEKYEVLKGGNWPTWEEYLEGDLSKVSPTIIDEIEKYSEVLGKVPFMINGPSDPVDGNIRIVFEV